MGERTLVPDAVEVQLECVKAYVGQFLLILRSAEERSCCPRCHCASDRVHSHYQRVLADLPWEGTPVRIELHVRRFFCDVRDCKRRIFTERPPHTVRRRWRYKCRSNLPSSCVEKLSDSFAATGVRMGPRRRPDVVTQEHGPALVPQQVGGYQDWGDPTGLPCSAFVSLYSCCLRQEACKRSATRCCGLEPASSVAKSALDHESLRYDLRTT
jgi:hypothetical protein